MFSCRTRGFCPSCQAKRVEEWGEWMRETLLWDVPHRQVVFTIPKRLRIFFKFDRRLLGDLCRSALRSLSRYFEVVTGCALRPGVIAAIQTFGDRINLHMHLHFLVTEGGTDEAGVFHKIPRIDDSRLAEIFAREVLAMLVRKELLSPEWAERILSWPHSGFNVHSLVRAKTKPELLLDHPERRRTQARFLGLSPVGIGIKAIVTDHDLPLVGNVRGHPGDELQIIHHLRLLPRAVTAPAITDLEKKSAKRSTSSVRKRKEPPIAWSLFAEKKIKGRFFPSMGSVTDSTLPTPIGTGRKSSGSTGSGAMRKTSSRN
jgi:hypothetical protein